MSIWKHVASFIQGGTIVLRGKIDATPKPTEFNPPQPKSGEFPPELVEKLRQLRAEYERKRRIAINNHMKRILLVCALIPCMAGCLITRTHAEAPDGSEVTSTRFGVLYGFGKMDADASITERTGKRLTVGDYSDGAAPDPESVAAVSKGATSAALEFIQGYFGVVAP